MKNLVDEQQWLSRLAEGQKDALETIYKHYSADLYRLAYKRLQHHEMSEDVVQDIFTQLWLKRKELKITNLPAYLNICVRNHVLTLFKKEKRYISFEDLLANNIKKYGDRADALTLRNEFLKAYNRLVESMPPRQRDIYKLSFHQGASANEIACQLSISRKTVQNHLSKAVTYLRSSLSLLVFLLIFFSTKK